MTKKYALPIFFLLAYLFTWSNWLPQALTSRGIVSMQVPGFLTLLAGYGPALAAIIVASLAYGRQGLRELFGRLLRWRVGFQWYLIALFLPVLITVLALSINNLTGGSPPDFSAIAFPFGPPETPLWQKILILFLVFTLGFDGLGEEIGWRGFALPRLLERYSPLLSSLTLGALWAVWHFPYALTEETSLSDLPLQWFFVNLLAISTIYTWIFIHTNGSLLPALLFHAAGNTTSNLLPILPPAASDLRIYYFTIAINCIVAILVYILSIRNLQSRKNLSGVHSPPDNMPA
jgi:membrane protease YdiL (CAAX protease family)